MKEVYVKKAIQLLNEKRKEGKVAQDNRYVFAVNNGSSKNALRGNHASSPQGVPNGRGRKTGADHINQAAKIRRSGVAAG